MQQKTKTERRIRRKLLSLATAKLIVAPPFIFDGRLQSLHLVFVFNYNFKL